VTALLAAAPLSAVDREAVRAEAIGLVEATRRAAKRQGVVESFLQEYSLGAKEGLALMALAEALLRTPDEDTRDKLIAEKITAADWASHAGKSDNLFVNASTWGLMLTGKLIDVEPAARADFPGYLRRLTARVGEPVIRAAVMQAIRIMGEQFVLGRDIDAALRRALASGPCAPSTCWGRAPAPPPTPPATRRPTPPRSRPSAAPRTAPARSAATACR
jgi:RHH-type proline utilization regulon transcriptional repressor/proline dehydrogenase/delta 1-pyrroline-5-carboxylate dehydrogenase